MATPRMPLIGLMAAYSTALTLPFNRLVAAAPGRKTEAAARPLPSALSSKERAWREKERAQNLAVLGKE